MSPRWVAALVLLAAACSGDDEKLPDARVAPPTDGAEPDAPTDAGIDADLRCAACTASQICVQTFNGTCGEIRLECQDRDPSCTGTACSAECNLRHCQAGGDAGIFTCQAGSCAGEVPGALHCYGP